MASLSIPAVAQPPSVPVTPVPALAPVGAVAAAMPAALLQAETDGLALPAAQPAPAAAQGDAAAAQDGAAMRPDQVIMARQLVWPNQDAGVLAQNWRGMVRNYGAQVAARAQQVRDGQLPAAVLLAGQEARMLRQPDAGTPLDAWRFTVHAGGPKDQHLRVIDADDAPAQKKGRRRGRAALRLELVLADGTVVIVQALPVADGVGMELWTPDPRTAARLRWLQPQLEDAVERGGLRVVSWTLRDTPPDGMVHARLPSSDAAEALTLPVFRALAELALLLPAFTHD